MTRDNSGKIDYNGNPGNDLQVTDVIECRECGNMVRRVNNQHLQTDRCKYTHPEKVRTGDDERTDLLRQNHPQTVDEYKEKYPSAPVISPMQKQKLSKANEDEEVSQRRRELLRRRWRGEDMSDIISSLSNRFEVAESTIRSDWSDRSSWIGRVFGLDDADAVVVESLAQKQDVRERLMNMARLAEDQNEIGQAVRALKAVDTNIDDTIEHQQKLGKVKKASSKHEIEVSGRVDHHHEPVGDELDTDTLEEIDELTGGDDEEIIDAKYEKVDDVEDTEASQ